MKVIIAGSRGITDIELVEEEAVEESSFWVVEVVSGQANGVDKLGEEWANQRRIPIKPFPADWKNLKAPGAIIKNNAYGRYNANAGFDRNNQMAEYADALVAITTGTPGTKHMIDTMKKLGKPVFVLRVK